MSRSIDSRSLSWKLIAIGTFEITKKVPRPQTTEMMSNLSKLGKVNCLI